MTAELPGLWAGHRLLDTVASLWPTARVSLAPGRRGPGSKELIYVPNSDDPRLLVPAGHARASSGAVLRFNHYLPGKDRIRRLIGALGLRVGAERLLAHRISIAEADPRTDSIETYLSCVLGRDVVVSLGIGVARANQKPVLQAFDQTGRRLAFVKVGDTASTRELVRGEAEALRRIGQLKWSAFAVPELVSLGSWHSFDVLVMSRLPIRARPAFRHPVVQPPAKAMRELGTRLSEGEQSVADSPFLQRLRSQVFAEADEAAAATFRESVDRIAVRFGDARLEFGAWHGDWSPWNMAWRGSRVLLWDWERFETGVPIGMDRIHYVLNTLARKEGFSAATIVRALRLSTAHEYTDQPRKELLGLLYLASISHRYLTQPHDPQSPIMARAAAALQALTWLSQAPDPVR